MFNKDFTPKQKAFLNEKFSHLEAVLTKSSINSHLQDEKLSTSKNTHTIAIKSCRRVSIEGGQIVNGENNTSN